MAHDSQVVRAHSLEASVVVEQLGSDAVRGLSATEVERRRTQFGPNSLPEAKGSSVLLDFLGQFKSPLIWLLLIAAVVALAMRELGDASVIVVVLMTNAIVGTVQERRAAQSMAALRKLARVQVRVVRDGLESVIDAATLVPGDVVLLAAGDAVPADARLLEASRFACAEAALTGESVPVSKAVELVGESRVLAEQSSMVFSGTLVTAGRARAVIVGTGMNTELGRIAGMTQADDEDTPLEARLAQFGKALAGLAVALFFVVLALGWLRDVPRTQLLMVGISQIVSVVPEGLPIALTIALAVGMRRMAQHRALVRHLRAVETLGCTTVICTDKTGTLTKNEMTVMRTWLPDGRQFEGAALPAQDPAVRELLDAATTCNDARLEAATSLGDPTELALLVLAREVGVPRVERARVSEVPFESASRLMATVHDGFVFVKGAPDAVLALCTGEAVMPATRVADAMAADALRVLAFARIEGALDTWEALKGRARLLGLCGEVDPPREGVAEAVKACQAAGIRIIMVTGDHRATGLTIARGLGIAREGDEAIDLSSEDLSQALSAQRLEKVAVFARVQPEQKLRIVEALQARGEVVAMTGDGVNDAPALVRADVGVAMGRSGTEVAREAADLVITDDDFKTIVRAVEEGRIVYRNIKKATLLLITSSVAEIAILLVALATGLPMPFAAVQILWNNLVTEGTITINLVMEPGEGDELSRPPIPRNEPIITRAMLGRLLYLATVLTAVVLGFYMWRRALGLPFAQVQSETFTLLAVCEWFNVVNCRSELRSGFKTSLLRNKWLLGGLIVSNLLQAAVIFTPGLNSVFHTVPFALSQVVLIGAAGSVVLWAEEARKAFARRLARTVRAERTVRDVPG